MKKSADKSKNKNTTKNKIKNKSKNKPLEEFVIIIDTREQNPYNFPANVKTISHSLIAGDYSLQGYASYIAIERKSKSDLYGCIFSGRKRFLKQIERLAKYRCSFVIVDCSFKDLLNPPIFSDGNPTIVIRTILSWMAKYRVPFIFSGSRQFSMGIVLRYLELFFKNKKSILSGKYDEFLYRVL